MYFRGYMQDPGWPPQGGKSTEYPTRPKQAKVAGINNQDQDERPRGTRVDWSRCRCRCIRNQLGCVCVCVWDGENHCVCS